MLVSKASLLKLLKYLWVGPITFLFLPLIPLAYWTGGSFAIHSGVIEISGGKLGQRLNKGLPLFGSAAAITLGHIVLGISPYYLDCTRVHEREHVRQFERWGFLFPFIYFGAGLWALTKGKRFYLDNPYEIAARHAEGKE
ncbi:hypothetical protein [uncultured Thiothrix sp.]|uniref:hypothetical protein n=1 Tax=uncultured Thiothrix sp. TaxID=223185 RepID=UPI00260F18BF|nr:hypothetical protein [uncultured Thiothrix sp.]